MPTPLNTVKSLTTTSELALVRASRPPEIGRLSDTELRAHAKRARALFDKWQDLAREQGRRRTGRGKAAPGGRTKEKVVIFREALDAFEARLAAGGGSSRRAPAGAKTPNHGATRAATRAKLTKLKTAHNSEARAARKASKAAKAKPADEVAAPSTPPKPAKPAKSAKQKTKKPWPLQSILGYLPGRQLFNVTPQHQLSARTEEKRSRIATSGLRSRVRGHVMVSGKRKQARRDARP